jgi:hypothetical protein
MKLAKNLPASVRQRLLNRGSIKAMSFSQPASDKQPVHKIHLYCSSRSYFRIKLQDKITASCI